MIFCNGACVCVSELFCLKLIDKFEFDRINNISSEQTDNNEINNSTNHIKFANHHNHV